MSGSYKRTYVRIPQDEYERLRRETSKLKHIKKEFPKLLDSVRKTMRNEYERIFRSMEERQRQYEKVVSSLKSNLKELERRNAEALREQRREFEKIQKQQREELLSEIKNVRDWAKNRFERQRNEYLKLTRENKRQIEKIKADVKILFEKEENREKLALAFLEDLEKLVSETESNLPHERFAPGKLNRIKEKIQAALSNVRSGLPQAAIANAQNAYFELVDLREEVITKKDEFELTYLRTLEAIRALLEFVHENRKVKVSLDERHVMEFEADYWTDGEYSRLQGEIEALERKLIEGHNIMTKKQVEEIMGEIGKLSNSIQKVLQNAVDRIISSQIRAELGDIIAESFREQGYDVEVSGYESNDQRKTYIVKVKNIVGTEVVTIISPESEGAEGNIIEVIPQNSPFSDDESFYRWFEEIVRPLKEEGIEVNAPQKGPQEDVSQIYDVEAIIRSGIPQSLRKKLKLPNLTTEKRQET